MKYIMCSYMMIFVLQSHGMENAQNLKVKSLSCIQKPCEVYCLIGPQILINTSNGCSVIDSQLDQKVKDITKYNIYGLRVMPDKKTMFFFLVRR